MRVRWSVCAVVVLCGCSGPKKPLPTTAVPPPPKSGGVISGMVNFEGTPLKVEPIASTDPACARLHHGQPIPNESFVLNPNQTLANVFVYLEGVKDKYPPPTEPTLIDQIKCQYVPRVLGVIAGQPITIRDSDEGVFHNVHAVAKANAGFNIPQVQKGQTDEQRFLNPEIMVEIKCDVHSWMHAYVGVMTHPFFSTTGPDGRFKIEGVPPGKYTLVAWHEVLPRQTQTIEIGKDEKKDVIITFKR